MLIILFILVFFLLSLFVVRPLLFLLGSKMFKIEQITFKKCIVVSLLTYALGILVNIAVYIFGTLFTGLSLHLVVFESFDILSLAGAFVVTIWVLKKKFKTTRGQSIGISAIFMVCMVTLVIFIRAFVIQSYAIPTGGMKPAVLIGDKILVNKFIHHFSEPVRGDVIAFKNPLKPSQIYLKRVIALGGETIRIYKDQVFIDGKPLAEPYVNKMEARIYGDDTVYDFPPGDANRWVNTFPAKYRNSVIDTDEGKAFMVPKDHYFCLGDNRNFSYDCRFWGPLPAGHVIGKAWGIYWSYESTTGEYLTFGIWPKIKKVFLSVPNFFTNTRWKRIGKSIE